MSLKAIFEKIESIDFAAYFSVAASLDMFLIGLENHEDMKELRQHLKQSQTQEQRVHDRLGLLLSVSPRLGFYHPHDVAIAAYLFALSIINKEQTALLSSLILETPQLWWARKLARRILEGMAATVDTRSSQSEQAYKIFKLGNVIFEIENDLESDDGFFQVDSDIDISTPYEYRSGGNRSNTGDSSLDYLSYRTGKEKVAS